MAEQDLGRGFGTLPGHLLEWLCPSCGVDSPVKDWKVAPKEFNQRTLEGRACPKCNHVMGTVGDTDVAKIAHRKRREQAREKPEPIHG